MTSVRRPLSLQDARVGSDSPCTRLRLAASILNLRTIARNWICKNELRQNSTTLVLMLKTNIALALECFDTLFLIAPTRMIRFVADRSALRNTDATTSMHLESTSQRRFWRYRYSASRKSGSQHGRGADPPWVENNISWGRESRCSENLARKTASSGCRSFSVVARLLLRGLSGRSSSHWENVWRAMSNISFLLVQFGKMEFALIIGSKSISLYILIKSNGSKIHVGSLAASVLLLHCDSRFFASSTITQYTSSAISSLAHLIGEEPLLVLLKLAVEFLMLWLELSLQQLQMLFTMLTIPLRGRFALPLSVFVGLLLGSCWVSLALPLLLFTCLGQVYIRNSSVLYALLESPTLTVSIDIAQEMMDTSVANEISAGETLLQGQIVYKYTSRMLMIRSKGRQFPTYSYADAYYFSARLQQAAACCYTSDKDKHETSNHFYSQILAPRSSTEWRTQVA